MFREELVVRIRKELSIGCVKVASVRIILMVGK